MALRLVTVLLAVSWFAGAVSVARAGPENLYVSPSGSDEGRCVESNPCLSLQRAFDVAVPGQLVRVAAGTYGGQRLTGDRGGAVTFRAQGEVRFAGRVVLDDARHVRLEGFAFTGDPLIDLELHSCNVDLTVRNATGRKFGIFEGNRQIRFIGGSWGGYSLVGEDSAIGTRGTNGPQITCAGESAPSPARDILFDGVRFHDVNWGVPPSEWDSHPDCFQINGNADRVTFRNSVFERCASTFVMVAPEQGPVTNVTFERNTFRQLGDTYYGIQLTGVGRSHACGNWVFRGNTYWPDNPDAAGPNSPIRTDCDAAPGLAPTLVTGNIFQRGPSPLSCEDWSQEPFTTRWSNNVFAESPCGEAVSVPFGYALRAGTLRLDRARAVAVRRVFALSRGRTSARTVARALRANRVPAPQGRRWSASLVKRVVGDRVYLGNVYGAKGSHPAIVGRRLWNAAQRVL